MVVALAAICTLAFGLGGRRPVSGRATSRRCAPSLRAVDPFAGVSVVDPFARVNAALATAQKLASPDPATDRSAAGAPAPPPPSPLALRYFLDTADEAEWSELLPLGIFHGVTTNPTLLEAREEPIRDTS